MWKAFENAVAKARLEGMQEGMQKSHPKAWEAFENAVAKARLEGDLQGRAEGRTEGRAEGRTEGRAEGRESTLIESVKNLMEGMNLTIEKAMQILKIPPEDQSRYMDILSAT